MSMHNYNACMYERYMQNSKTHEDERVLMQHILEYHTIMRSISRVDVLEKVQQYTIDEFIQRFPHYTHMVDVTHQAVMQTYWYNHALSLLFESRINNVLVLYIPPHVIIDEPLFLKSWYDQGIEKISIIIDEGASIIIDDQVSKNYTFARALDCWVLSHARVSFMHSQSQNIMQNSFYRMSFYLDTYAHLALQMITQNSVNMLYVLDLVLYGCGADAQVRAAGLLGQSQKVRIISHQKHIASHTISNVLLKTVVHTQSYVTYSGTITIMPEAYKSQARQENKNILLTTQAHAQSIPNLEVLVDDVQCAHGSAVGKLDVEQLWYLQSRGMPLHEAQLLLLNGFLCDLFESDEMQKKINSYLKTLLS